MNVPTFEELKQALQIPEITPEYDRAGREIKQRNLPIFFRIKKWEANDADLTTE